jgi:hypothetical protein
MSDNKRLPQDISNLLAIAIRDLIWYKEKIISFFNECCVPKSIIIQVEKNKHQATIKTVQFVLDELFAKGDDGYNVAKTILTKIYYWKDIYSIPIDRKDKAISSLKELQKAYKQYNAQEQYNKEKEMQKVREERVKIKALDHNKLKDFRDRFDQLFILDPQERGNLFEKLLNDVFDYYFIDSFKGFKRIGEQIDGQFYFDGHWYYIEVRWKEDQTIAADISILRDRARNAFSGDVRAVFISFNGFTDDCINSLESSGEKVILLNGYDFRLVLECNIALDVLLHNIQAHLIKNKVNYVSAKDIIEIIQNK